MVLGEKTSDITLLDGGMGRELMRMGAPFRQPEWSGLALIESPELVKKAHESFAVAGSDILTTSNYAVVPFHIGEERFAADGPRLISLAGQLAREAGSPYGCRIAGSIPPLFGSYRPDLFVPTRVPQLLEIIAESLSPHVDFWLAETVSSIEEAEALAEVLSGDARPLWISFTLLDDRQPGDGISVLRSGERVIDAVHSAIKSDASAILFNCSCPEVMEPAVAIAKDKLERLDVEMPIGVYANAFPPQKETAEANSDICEIREDLDPAGYMTFVDRWLWLGAKIIGGCCGIGPEHIALLHQRLKRGKKV